MELTSPRPKRVLCALVTLSVLTACSPITLHKLSLVEAYQTRSISALERNRFSDTTRIVLQRQNLLDLWTEHPRRTLAALHKATQSGFYSIDLPTQLFALAELNYLQARRQNDPALFMTAALYAYAYLSPDEPAGTRPSPYDPHFRQACDIYMLSLTEALGTPARVAAQSWTLPIGKLELSANPADLNWHNHILTDLRPTARISVTGFNNIYTQFGLGEPLAAVPRITGKETETFQVTDKMRVPVNLFIRIPNPRMQMLSGHVSGHLTLTASEPDGISTQNAVPLQYDPTTARGVSLAKSINWSDEYTDFLNGQYFDSQKHLQLASIEPHRAGRIPVVLVHGTASSPARWEDLINDLMADPEIRRHFEFWVFSYGTGNPIPYSALQLRESLQDAIKNLGGSEADPALSHMILIGHSQGGLLIKMLAINAGDRLWNGMISTPFKDLSVSDPIRNLLQEALFPCAMPEIRNVIFISTPQHGSYLATLSVSRFIGRFMTFPLTITHIMKQIVVNNAEFRLDMSPWRLGSVYGMSPQSKFIQSLAKINISPDIEAHSIIPVTGDGPSPTATDGVVEYESAHITDVNSELVVKHSTHSTQSNPVTIAEVRRILFEQLQAMTNEKPPPGDMEKQNIVRIGGVYVPTRRQTR